MRHRKFTPDVSPRNQFIVLALQRGFSGICAVAAAAGMHRYTLCRALHGGTVRLQTAERLAVLLNVSVAELGFNISEKYGRNLSNTVAAPPDDLANRLATLVGGGQ